MSIRDVRRLLPAIEATLRSEGELVLTRRGRPVARLVPVTPDRPHRPSNEDLRRLMPLQEITSEQLVREGRDARG